MSDSIGSMTINLKKFKQPEALADHVSELLMNMIGDTSSYPFHLAISGGSTPNLLFSTLAAKYADSELWQKTHFWWVDERMVSPADPESNYGKALQYLFSKITIPQKNIHRIRGEKDPVIEAEDYAQQIKAELKMKDGWPSFDLILLGMGEDGHTASIFPGQMDLLLSDHLCVVACHPVSFQKRITLTGNVINNAQKIIFMVTGANKAERLSEIRLNGEKGKLLPASHIQPVGGELFWYTDESAAQLLK